MLHTIKQFLLMLLLLLSAACVSCKKSSEGYTHNASQPTGINSFSPATGALGTVLLIKGSNFTSDTAKIKVTINGVPLLVVGVNGQQVMAAVTAKTGSGPIQVAIDGKASASTDTFTYIFSYAVTTIAGSGTAGFNDGIGTGASFNFNGVRGQLSVDKDLNIYVADGGNQRIRKIAPDGTVVTIAGNGTNGYVDGPGSQAQFNNPCGTAVDKDGNIYVSERNGRHIRKISPDGTVSTYAGGTGNGTNELTSVAVNQTTGAVYWTDFYGDGIYQLRNGSIQKVINHSLPCTIAIDAQGNIYATHYDDEQVLKYTYDAAKDSFDGGTAIAGASHTAGMSDGQGTAASFARPWGIALDAANNLYVSGQGGGDHSNNVRFITQGTWNVSTIAGVGDNTGYIDGLGGDARFNQPTGVAVDKNNDIYILDMGNNRIRKITVK